MNLLEKEEFVWVKVEELENVSLEDIICYVVEIFLNIIFVCSFGVEDVVFVDMLQKISLFMDVFYFDIDFYFKEMYEICDFMKEKYNMDFVCVFFKIMLEEQVI